MQNSTWKLISVIGVVAIGTLVVLEVQQRIPASSKSVQSAGPIPLNVDQETAITPHTEPSDFERDLMVAEPSEEDQFSGASLHDNTINIDFDEPDLGIHDDFDTKVDHANLTEKHDSLTPDPTSDFTSVDAIALPGLKISSLDKHESAVVDDSNPFEPGLYPAAQDDRNPTDPFATSENTVVPAGRTESSASALTAEPFSADSESSVVAPATPNDPPSAAVDSPTFLPPGDRSETVTSFASEPPAESSATDPSSVTHVPDDGGSAAPVDGLQHPADQTDAFGHSPALQPVPDPGGTDPEFFVDEKASRTEGTSVTTDPVANSDTSTVSEENVDTGDSLPFFNQSVEATDPPNPVPHATDRSSSRRSIAGDHRADDSDTTPSDPLQPRTEDVPDLSQIPFVQDQTNELRNIPDLQHEPFLRRDSESIEIRSPNDRKSDAAKPGPTVETFPAKLHDRPPSSTHVLRPHLSFRKLMPPSATLGQPLSYTLVVTNEGKATARDVVVEDVVPSAARLDGVEPPADYEEETRKLVWNFDELQPGDSRELKIQLTPTDQGILRSVATVRFRTQVTTSTVVRIPKLTLKFTAAEHVRLGEETQLRYIVRNDGDGAATDVILRSDLPAGLSHPIGNDLEYNIETLMPDEERQIVLDVIATEPGQFTSTAELLAAGVSGETAEVEINVLGQQIQLVRRGPRRRYVGRSAKYENILSNETAFEASGIRVVEQIPEGMKFAGASHNGVYNPQDRAVIWTVDRIDAAETKTLSIELLAMKSGDQESSVTVLENAGFETSAQHITAVEDLHNIGTRMSHLDGPVFVGEEFGFDIVVQNRGTADATGILLTVDLPDGVKGVSVGKDGPRAVPDISGGQLLYRFEPIKRIGPAEDITIRINLKATEPISNGIVNVRVRSDQMENELVTSESVTAGDDSP